MRFDPGTVPRHCLRPEFFSVSRFSDAYLHVFAAFIFGGEDAGDRYPYLVSLRWPGTLQHFCSGALINAKAVLTAAHCVDTKDGMPGVEDPIVHIGRVCASCPETGYRTGNTERVIIHPKWESRVGSPADLALIILRESVDGPFLRTLPQPELDSFSSSTSMWVMGWGQVDDFGAGARTLQHAELFYIDNEQCRQQYARQNLPDAIPKDAICAESGVAESCPGDSGSPLILKGDSWEDDVAVGIVSFGNTRCGDPGSGAPGVFISLSHYVPDLNVAKSFDPSSPTSTSTAETFDSGKTGRSSGDAFGGYCSVTGCPGAKIDTQYCNAEPSNCELCGGSFCYPVEDGWCSLGGAGCKGNVPGLSPFCDESRFNCEGGCGGTFCLRPSEPPSPPSPASPSLPPQPGSPPSPASRAPRCAGDPYDSRSKWELTKMGGWPKPQCRKLCNNNPDCAAFVFNSDTALYQCSLFRRCSVVLGAPGDELEYKVALPSRPPPPPGPPSCLSAAYKTLTRWELANLNGDHDQACKDQCAKEPQCKASVFNEDTPMFMCRLFDNCSAFTPGKPGDQLTYTVKSPPPQPPKPLPRPTRRPPAPKPTPPKPRKPVCREDPFFVFRREQLTPSYPLASCQGLCAAAPNCVAIVFNNNLQARACALFSECTMANIGFEADNLQFVPPGQPQVVRPPLVRSPDPPPVTSEYQTCAGAPFASMSMKTIDDLWSDYDKDAKKTCRAICKQTASCRASVFNENVQFVCLMFSNCQPINGRTGDDLAFP
mmetsp:Transcript_17438/g.48604  ORF Transcript_17438/g.48604 Transcript_17438/m.48604 type:complete len:769 (+) Transcript_17438:988-3294(+)